MNKRLYASLLEIYNEFSLKKVMIISWEDFRNEAERIAIQFEEKQGDVQ